MSQIDRRSPPGLSHLFDVDVETERPRVIQTPFGTRLTVVVSGGKVTGQAIEGRVLHGAGDCDLTAPTGDIWRVDVQLTIATEAGALVYCQTGGVVDLPPDAHDRLSAGNWLAADEVYFRVTPRFETGADELGWLNRIVALGVGSVSARGASIEVFQVL